MTKKQKNITIIIASILALALVGVIIFFSLQNNGSNTPSKDDNSEKPTSNVSETVSKTEVNNEELSLTFDDVKAKKGSTVEVPVRLNHNPGIAASAIEITYNGDKLTYLGYDKGEVFENYHFTQAENSIRFSNIEDKDSKKSGIMFTLKFQVSEDAVEGDTEVKVNITDESFINFDEEFIKVSGGNAIVTIEK